MPFHPRSFLAILAGTAILCACGGGSSSGAANPVSTANGFYLNPYMQSARWVQDNAGDARAAVIRDQIASKPAGVWFGGWETDIQAAVRSHVDAAQASRTLPILVAYHIPLKGSGSGGGAASAQQYRGWIAGFAAGIGQRSAVVILEPDALAELDRLPSDADRTTRTALLSYAVDTLAESAPNAWVYIDAGNSGWLTSDVAASRLLEAGIRKARGFALNVSNYIATADLTLYGQAIHARLNSTAGISRTFVIDTSRNGNGASGAPPCDPAGRRIGEVSQYKGEGAQPEMVLWVKPPGEADGCAASAGSFSPELAHRLATGS